MLILHSVPLNSSVPLKSIEYKFLVYKGREKFEGVEIEFAGPPGKYKTQILDILTQQYGQYTKMIGDGKAYVFEDKYVTVVYPTSRSLYGIETLEIQSKEILPVLSKVPAIYLGF